MATIPYAISHDVVNDKVKEYWFKICLSCLFAKPYINAHNLLAFKFNGIINDVLYKSVI